MPKGTPFVVGVDACRTGWVGIALSIGGAHRALWARTIDALAGQVLDASVLAIDIPIGLADVGNRLADVAARSAMSGRSSTVFLTPIREALEAPTHPDASRRAREVNGTGISTQAYGLRARIFEVEEWIESSSCDVREVHPELCFAAMAGHPLSASKKSWAGAQERLRLLDRVGIRLADDFGIAGTKAAHDDVLDAAAAAWTAARIASGTAISYPPVPTSDSDPAIWA